MKVRFLGQPFPESGQIGILLREGLDQVGTYQRLWLATAWAKWSGVSRIHASVQAFRDQGGTAEAIVGIDEGGTTTEALQLSAQLFDPFYIYFDTGNRTFHPKLYVLEGETQAQVIIGSGNMTKGGLFTNYEAAISIDLNMGEAEDAAILKQVRDYFEQLLATGDACRLYSDELLEELWADPRVRIVSEQEANTRHRQRRDAIDGGPAGDAVFGKSIKGLAGAPAPDVEALLNDAADEDAVLPEVDEGEAEAAEPELVEGGPAPQVAGVLGFWKAMSHWDASRHSAPGQIQIPIRFRDFFPTLEVQLDGSATGGPSQSQAEFALEFRDGEFNKHVATGRVILYEPAANHARPNIELRFTFRDRDVFDRLNEDDVLVFSRADGAIIVERRSLGSMGAGRYGSL